jgi:type I restriction enzyme M protein
MSDIVNKLWGFCHTLRHDGVDYGDYIEQLTYLLFLKMMEEKGISFPDIPNYKNTGAAKPVNWTELKKESGTELIDLYAEYLRHLREQPGIVGEIYTQSLPRLNNPVNLKRLINLINEEEWTGLDVDVKGEAFEGLLERAASEGKKGAGQYFTPRPLIQSIVRVMKPDPRGKADFKITDPSCGTGGFLVAAYEWLIKESGGAFDRNEVRRIKEKTYYGQELVPRPRRLALMNLYLHGVMPTIYLGDSLYEAPRPEKYDVILANPPFGTKGANQVPDRDDFTVSTASKQLNFMQHFLSVLRPGGRAAVVLPDNCLFEDKAGEIFKILMQDCDLHTIMRLPRGTFTPYAQGVKANVVFFRKGPRTEHVWIYDNRSNIAGITKKDRPLTAGHFAEFEACYGPDPNGQSLRTERERFKRFSLAEIKERGYKLDITWLKDESLDDADSLPEPQDLVTEAVAELEAVVDELKEIMVLLDEK